MEHPMTWSRSAATSSELPGVLLLMSSSVVLIGMWSALWFTRVPLSPERGRKEWHPVALEQFHEACQAGNGTACNDLGVSYERGYGTTPNSGKAFEAFERACRAGSPDGCNNQGAMLERGWGAARDVEDLKRARALYQQACEKGAGLGCSNLGALYAKGKGVPRNTGGARWLFERACQKGCATGCNNLIALYEPRPRGNSI
jgi:TPR repeat protein